MSERKDRGENCRWCFVYHGFYDILKEGEPIPRIGYECRPTFPAKLPWKEVSGNDWCGEWQAKP